MTDIYKMTDIIRKKGPLIYQITNFVSANDCANAVLAIGATTVMSQEIEEVEEILAHADALVLNLGTPSKDKIKTMIKAGETASESGIPIVFDPVGGGSTKFRKEAVRNILHHVNVSVIRGNLSEILSLSEETPVFAGVDSAKLKDKDKLSIIKDTARHLKCVIAATGEDDIITDGEKMYICHNGCPEMARLTGTGCICSALIGTFAGASPDSLLNATTAAVVFMGISGEQAWKYNGHLGYGHFHMGLIDEFGKLTGEIISKEMRLDEIV